MSWLMRLVTIFTLRRLTPVLGVALCLASSITTADGIQHTWTNIDRIVAIGDIHGDYENYRRVMREAGLTDKRGRWAAGKTHFVQVGDIPDRGPDTRKITAHLQKLEKQALKNGGRVHILVGNHEFMNATGDLRYVHPGEYEAFKSRNSKAYLDNYYQQVVAAITAKNEQLLAEGSNATTIIDEAFKTQWYRDHPPGYIEHRLSWQKGGEMNRWVSQHNSVIRINNILFMHAGLGAPYTSWTLSDINTTIRSELRGEGSDEPSLGDNQAGPLWYRGLAKNDEVDEEAHLASLLEAFGVDMIVVGHTPNLGVITPRFGGRVVIIDTGISDYYGGNRGSLLIEGDSHVAIHGRHHQPMPRSNADTLDYFKALAAQKPDNERLHSYVSILEKTTDNLVHDAP